MDTCCILSATICLSHPALYRSQKIRLLQAASQHSPNNTLSYSLLSPLSRVASPAHKLPRLNTAWIGRATTCFLLFCFRFGSYYASELSCLSSVRTGWWNRNSSSSCRTWRTTIHTCILEAGSSCQLSPILGSQISYALSALGSLYISGLPTRPFASFRFLSLDCNHNTWGSFSNCQILRCHDPGTGRQVCISTSYLTDWTSTEDKPILEALTRLYIVA